MEVILTILGCAALYFVLEPKAAGMWLADAKASFELRRSWLSSTDEWQKANPWKKYRKQGEGDR